MSKVSMIAKLTAVDGKQAELEDVLAALIAAADEEDGLEIYSVHRSDEDGVYYFFELYRDDEAFAVHGRGDQMKAAMGRFGGLLAGPPELIKMTPLTAKGLDL